MFGFKKDPSFLNCKKGAFPAILVSLWKRRDICSEEAEISIVEIQGTEIHGPFQNDIENTQSPWILAALRME